MCTVLLLKLITPITVWLILGLSLVPERMVPSCISITYLTESLQGPGLQDANGCGPYSFGTSVRIADMSATRVPFRLGISSSACMTTGAAIIIITSVLTHRDMAPPP